MKFLGLRKEKTIQKKGYKLVAGTDEVGRGSLAGPVVACAVAIKDFNCIKGLLRDINDSKKLSFKKREELFNFITKEKSIEWGMGVVSSKIIDKTNIFLASKKAMKKAVINLNMKLKDQKLEIDYLILDGNFKIDINFIQEPVIKGDQKVFSCAAASVLAKVYRDKLMIKLHKKYLNYGFNENKGYGTAFHIRQIREYGYCDIHRKSFRVKKERF